MLMRVLKKHISKLLTVVQKCVSTIQICFNLNYLQVKNNIFGFYQSIAINKETIEKNKILFLIRGD